MCGVATTCGSLREPPVGRRLGFEHVEPGAGDLARFDRVGQRRFVDQLSARRVHDSDTGLAAAPAARALNRWRVSGVDGRCSVM